VDLKVIPPSNRAIYYGDKTHSGGQLDIDMNAGGRNSTTPVENIYFR
jgi:hypothetical protein